MTLTRSLILLAAATLPLACSGSLDPTGELHVDFSSSPADNSRPPVAPTLSVSRGRIEAAGSITTGDPCVDLRAETSRAAHRISITTIARRQDVACIQVLASFAYRAAVSGLEPGTYQVVLSNAWEDPRGVRQTSQVVLDQTVTVP
jgi:hypothetical protein